MLPVLHCKPLQSNPCQSPCLRSFNYEQIQKTYRGGPYHKCVPWPLPRWATKLFLINGEKNMGHHVVWNYDKFVEVCYWGFFLLPRWKWSSERSCSSSSSSSVVCKDSQIMHNIYFKWSLNSCQKYEAKNKVLMPDYCWDLENLAITKRFYYSSWLPTL